MVEVVRAASYSLEAGQSSDRAEVYWSLAPDTGAISLRGDLTNKLYFEYRLVDRAGVRADQLFRGQLNAAKDCVLVLARSGLDPETMPSYTVTLHLATLPGLVSPQGQEAVVRVEVLDRNDNPPVWQQEQGDRGWHQRGQAAGHRQGQRGAGQGELLPLCGHPGPRSALLQCGPGLGGGEDGAAPGGGRLNEND